MIHRIDYNEMRCDGEDCTASRRVYWGCPDEGWFTRTEGKPWDGTTGGYREYHYCPDCAARLSEQRHD